MSGSLPRSHVVVHPFSYSDDDDEEGDEGEEEGTAEHPGRNKPQKNEEEEVNIKATPADTFKEEEVPNKLHEYKTAELQKFKERDMKVDVQALEGV